VTDTVVSGHNLKAVMCSKQQETTSLIEKLESEHKPYRSSAATN